MKDRDAVVVHDIGSGPEWLSQILSAATEGKAAMLYHDAGRVAVVDAERLRIALAALCPSPVEVVRENDSWTVTVRGLPLTTRGADLDTLIEEVLTALRNASTDLLDSARITPNHYGDWVTGQLIALSDDAQLRDWMIGGACVHIR